MGLTIHYSLTSTGQEADARDLVHKLHRAAQDLPFDEVSDAVEFQGDECDSKKRDKADPHRGLLISACQYLSLESGYLVVVPEPVIAFTTWPGAGCEFAKIGLCRYPHAIERQGRRFKTGLTGWSWQSFCKTQYASDPQCGGAAHFLRCHLAVIALLDAAKRLGYLKSVSDEGGFWENRSIEARAKTVGDWNVMIAAFGGALKSLWAESGGHVESPITNYSNFEHLEAEGQKHLPAVLKVLAELERLGLKKR